MTPPDGDTDGLIGAIAERLSAELERGTTTLRLALAETRLAASSAALLLGIVLALVALALLIWLLLVALAGYGLWRLGLSPAAVLALLLAVHAGAALALALLARRLAADLRFAHTRRALSARAERDGRWPGAGDPPAADAPEIGLAPSDRLPPGSAGRGRA